MPGELAKQGKAVSFLVQWPTHINVQYKAEIDWAKENHYPLTASSSENDPALQKEILKSIAEKDVTAGLYCEPDNTGHGHRLLPQIPEYAAAVVNTNAILSRRSKPFMHAIPMSRRIADSHNDRPRRARKKPLSGNGCGAPDLDGNQ